ncbi:MAG TPA: MFS transporter [Burkholderiaceae bacterium]|nr:MFS transporter [Burkholderiaceae bacterium]
MPAALLQRFANIRRDEVAPVLVAALFFFCVLCALMVLRPAREALGMQRGMDAIRWLFIGTVVVTLLVNPLFGMLVSRFRRLQFIAATYLFFVVGLLCFHALLVLAPAAVGERSGQVFYVWFSVFNLFATMLFWALMADRFTEEQSKRVFGAIAVGGTLGAIFGPWLASVLARPLGTPALMLVAAGFLMLSLAAAWWLTRVGHEIVGHEIDSGDRQGAGATGRRDRPQRAGDALIGGSAWEGLSAIMRSPFLLGICGYVLILAVMVTFLYFTRLQMVAALGTDLDMRTATFARIDMITQIATLVLQAIVTGHLMKRLGTSLTLALLPMTALLGFVGLAIVGSLAALVAFEATFRAVQRGIMRPARETLFTSVTRAERYKAKAFIDTFVYRAGDVVGAQTEGLLGRLGMGLAALAAFAAPLALVWMTLGLWLGWAQRGQPGRIEAEQGEGARA